MTQTYRDISISNARISNISNKRYWLQYFISRHNIKLPMSAASLLWLTLHAAPGGAETLDIGTFAHLAQRCGPSVATLTLAAIAKTESRFQTLVVADNTTHISRIYHTADQAASAAGNLITKGHSVDLGIMQINSANLRRLGMTARDAFDACKSISAAATLMTKNFLVSRRSTTQQIALRNAISMYNTGNSTNGYRNGYVHRVEYSAATLSSYFSNQQSSLKYQPIVPTQIEVGATNISSWDVWNTPNYTISNSPSSGSVQVL